MTMLTTHHENGSIFNISLGIQDYISSLSTRFFSRLKRIDELLSQEDFPLRTSFYANGQASPRIRGNGTSPFQPLPAPWAFVTSGYAIGLLVVALLLNRIQNIVVPPRATHPTRPQSRRSSFTYLTPFWTIWSFLFPIDLSSTISRSVMRIPSLYLLAKSLLLWTIILLQCFNLYPSIEWNWVQVIGNWAASAEIEDVCWSTFGAICLALCIGALTRGLEGIGTENTVPFNLFGYAFLLHIYSSSLTHVKHGDGLPTRPNKHVIVTIVLPLLQLSLIHFLGVKQSWSRRRLVPTSICSMLSLVHFHSVFWTSPTSYPLLNYFPAFLESFLALATLLACGLNILTQVLLEGSVKRPVFGHAESLAPKWDEDFSIVLLRLGTASLEATNVAGLGNEVGGISVSESWLDQKPNTSGARRDSFTMELNRSGASSTKRRGQTGFHNEIRNIRAASSSGTSHGVWINSVLYAELMKFWAGMWKVIKGFWRLIRSGSLRIRPLGVPELSTSSQPNQDPDADEEDTEDSYERSIRDIYESRDEGDYDNFPSSSFGRTSSSDSSDHGNDQDSTSLSADISSTSSTISVLLAHTTETSMSPMIRRRYRRSVATSDGSSDDEPLSEAGQDGDEFWTGYAKERRKKILTASAEPDNELWNESRRNCVVCTCQPRQIICWPCRCLALCDDCRENLASRSSAAKHTCPCCRRSVDGFSRIYIP